MAFECVHGTLGGVNFGDNMKVICRSPKGLLLWVPGHAYWSGRQSHYGAASMYLIATRNTNDVYRHYKEIIDGGRLSAGRIVEQAEKIDTVFGEGSTGQIIKSFKAKETLLIDGGGDPLTPSHKELRRRHRASNPPAPPTPKFEHIGFSEEQIDRLMDAARDRLENANDEIGQQVWRKLEAVKMRLQPRPKVKTPVIEGPLRL